MKNKQAVVLDLIANLGAALFATCVTLLCGFIAILAAKEIWLVGLGLALGTALSTALFWTRRRVAAVSAVAASAVAALTLVLLPVVNDSSRDAVKAEAEQVLGSVKNHVRVVYAKQGHAGSIRTLTGPREAGGCDVSPAELEAKYFRVRDEVVHTETAAMLFAEPMPGYEHKGTCTYTFAWEGGQGEFVWSPP